MKLKKWRQLLFYLFFPWLLLTKSCSRQILAAYPQTKVIFTKPGSMDEYQEVIGYLNQFLNDKWLWWRLKLRVWGFALVYGRHILEELWTRKQFSISFYQEVYNFEPIPLEWLFVTPDFVYLAPFKAAIHGDEGNGYINVNSLLEKGLEEVKRFVPKERLLIMSIRDGWKPICKFLELPEPKEAFPIVEKPYSCHVEKFLFRLKIVKKILLVSLIAMVTLPLISAVTTYFYLKWINESVLSFSWVKLDSSCQTGYTAVYTAALRS